MEACCVSKLLSRNEILEAQDLDKEQVAVPEWGGDILIRGGSADERDAFDISIMEGKGANRQVNMKRLRVKLLALALVDEAGNRLFSEADLALLAKKNAKVIERLFKVAQRLWGIGKEEVSEFLSGESVGERSADSGTDSPGNGATPHLVTQDAN